MNSSARRLLIPIGLIAVIAVLVSVYFLFPAVRRFAQSPSLAPAPTPTPLPTPTPIIIPPGKQTYNISSKGIAIKLTQAIFDPLDAAVGQSQTISVKVSNGKSIDSVSVTFMGDEATRNVPLTLASGTVKDGVWSKTWTVDLPHTKIYSAKITATGGESSDSVDLWFR